MKWCAGLFGPSVGNVQHTCRDVNPDDSGTGSGDRQGNTPTPDPDFKHSCPTAGLIDDGLPNRGRYLGGMRTLRIVHIGNLIKCDR
jgi:hypothetical protein